ncbi:MAG: hypothetical protein QXS68_04135 [Candidatus Methanomethylicaceae archaeon]
MVGELTNKAHEIIRQEMGVWGGIGGNSGNGGSIGNGGNECYIFIISK